jgi:hypothetical protein
MEVFEVVDRNWRGIGPIAQSGYRLRPEYAAFDAEKIFGVEAISAPEPPECISALVLQGLKKPLDCPMFGARCTPAPRWERRWFRARAPAPRIINTGAMPRRWERKRERAHHSSLAPCRWR